MRAPPESLRPMIGAPTFIARSMTLQIFSAYASDNEPPKTVKSWLKTKTVRPSIVPWPVTTPSPRNDSVAVALRFVTNASSSTNDPGSSSKSRRSRAVSLPASCCFATLAAPPPSRDCCAHLLERANRSAFVDTVRRSHRTVFAQGQAPSYPSQIGPPMDRRISTDSVNNSQSVWITRVREPGYAGVRWDPTRSPAPTASVPARRF